MTAPNAPAQPGLDLGKPMRWTDGNRATLNVVYHDMRGALVERASGYRDWHDLDILERRAENIPPEPPRGPEEVWVSVYHNGFVTWTACASEGAALDMIACVNPARAGAAVRYIRADLAVRKVKPLTEEEYAALLKGFYNGGHGITEAFNAVMAARGIEVGE